MRLRPDTRSQPSDARRSFITAFVHAKGVAPDSPDRSTRCVMVEGTNYIVTIDEENPLLHAQLDLQIKDAKAFLLVYVLRCALRSHASVDITVATRRVLRCLRSIEPTSLGFVTHSIFR